MFSKKFLSGAALTALTVAMGAGVAQAQSTGSQVQEEETIVVTGARRSIEGTIIAETVPKTRATIDSEFIDRQSAGQSILNTVNLIPGVNFTNNDPYGSSGGNLTIRGFDGPRVSLTFDGIPLNDTGNYAIFSNQQLDPELITRASVNMGTTDVDSPTASAAGGTLNYTTRRPEEEFGLMLQGGLGDFNYRRAIGILDTGAFGPLDTTGFLSGSWTEYDKWKGPGEIFKRQLNARLFQDLGDGDFVSLSVHYNRNRNNFYRNIDLNTFNTNPGLENDISCTRPTPVNGVAQNESNQSTIVRWDGVTVNNTSCTNYHGLRINPSDTGNIRGQMSFGLTDNVRITLDPSFQYVIANGGGFTAVSERDDRLDLAGGNAGGPGVDLNGDGDVLDTVSLYTPNTTNTRRYGLTGSVIWDMNDNHRLRFAYTLDYGRHRQTGDFGFLGLNGEPEDVYGGKDGYGRVVPTINGNNLQGRSRYSVALLNQFALEYRGFFFDDDLTINLGVRAPMFSRRLNQFCYSQDGSSNVRCTDETPSVFLANGNVRFTSTGTTEFLAPYRARVGYDAILPNVGLNYRLGDNSSIYFSYAEGLSAPRTDNLYTVSRGLTPTSIDFSNAEPETTQAYDLGYRFQSSNVVAQFSLWQNNYDNRIVSAFDDTLGFFVDRNIGSVELRGVDAQIGFSPIEPLTIYASASYIETEMQNNIPLGASPTFVLPTAGRSLVETPEWTYAGRVEWDITEFLSVGLQGKYVGDRFATDMNDQVAPAYTVADFDLRLDLDFLGASNSFLQVNVTNIFDEAYVGSISSRNNAVTIADADPGTPGNQPANASQPTYGLGAPRTVMVTLRSQF